MGNKTNQTSIKYRHLVDFGFLIVDEVYLYFYEQSKAFLETLLRFMILMLDLTWRVTFSHLYVNDPWDHCRKTEVSEYKIRYQYIDFKSKSIHTSLIMSCCPILKNISM